jgi:flagellar basal-body rod protein FlgC
MNMDYLQAFAVSAAGMSVERARVEVAALNLANAHAVQATGQPGYQSMRVVASAGGFAGQVSEALGALPVPTANIEATGAPARLVHDPGHPLADARGFVAYPGVDPAAEMVELMSATRAYEANVAAMNAARTLALKTLDIGRGT